MIPRLNKVQNLSRICCPLANQFFQQQVRTTFILKRQSQPFLKEIDAPRPRPLRSRHFQYDLVVDTNTVRQPDVSVILTSYVEGLGDRGTVVSVRPSIARFHLLLPGLAVYASPENMQMLRDDILLSKEKEPAFSSIYSPITMKLMRKTVFGVTMSCDQPWTISAWHVRAAIRMAGFVVPEAAIELPVDTISGPNLDNQNKDFSAFVTINGKEKFAVRCRLHHAGLPLEEGWQLERSTPILSEQQEILGGIPLPDVQKNKINIVASGRKR